MFEPKNRRETILVLGLLLIVLLVNLATALRYPAVWMDEAMYTDPAANLVMGNGFTSTAWYDQTSDRFWAGNTPLHELILSGWIKFFGFSPLSVRAINYIWLVLGAFLVWRFCVHFRYVEKTALRLLLIVLLATGSAVSFSYRSGRPDMIGFFLVTLALFMTVVQKNSVRHLCLFSIGILFPWAGLQLLPFLAIATVLVLVFWGIRAALNGVSIGLGAGIGLLMLYFFYQSHHVWHDFVASVTRHTTGSASAAYGHGRISAIPDVFIRDHSAPFLLALGMLLLIQTWQARDAVAKKIVLFALGLGICIPLGMHFGGIFPIYYGWMSALPTTIVLCDVMSRRPLNPLWMKVSAILLLSGAIAIGLPSRLLVAALRTNETSYAAVEQFASTQLKASDNAYIDYAAFYPAMHKAKKVFFQRYMENAMTPEEKKSVTVLVVDPGHLYVTNSFTGNWRLTAELKDDTGQSSLPAFLVKYLQSPRIKSVYFAYHLAVYRKIADDHSQPFQ